MSRTEARRSRRPRGGERPALSVAGARWAVGLVAFVGLAVSGALALRALAPGNVGRPAVPEVIAHLAILLALFSLSAGLRQAAAALPRAYTVPLATMFLLMFVAQLFGRSSVTFPFATWTMYGSADRQEAAQYYRLMGRHGDGTRIAVEPRELFTAVANWGLIARLDDDSESRGGASLNELARTYLLRYREEHPTEALASLAIERCRLPTFPRGEAECVELAVSAPDVGP